jgi:hypothetical protein
VHWGTENLTAVPQWRGQWLHPRFDYSWEMCIPKAHSERPRLTNTHHESGRPQTPSTLFLLLLWILYKVSQAVLFVECPRIRWGVFPYPNIDTKHSIYLAFSCERLSMVMCLHPCSHICSDSWHQEALIVPIDAYWPNDIFSFFSDRHGAFPFLKFSWDFLVMCPTYAEKGSIFKGSSSSFPLAFFFSCQSHPNHNHCSLNR